MPKLYIEETFRRDYLISAAQKMLAAARTAPKARGMDHLTLAYILNDTIQLIADQMIQMAQSGKAGNFFIRDAHSLQSCEVMVLIGTSFSAMGIQGCTLCGFSGCEEKNQHPDHPCVFNTGDLGIAIGSAVSVAMEMRVDNRIMYSAGMAARELNLLGSPVKVIYGIPLSVSSKNPFFDRKPL